MPINVSGRGIKITATQFYFFDFDCESTILETKKFYDSIARSSTSNIRVALLGIRPGMPRGP